MKKLISYFLIVIICIGSLTACEHNQIKNKVSTNEDILKNGVADFIASDAYSFSNEIIEQWTSDEGQSVLVDCEETNPVEVAFIRGNLALDNSDYESATNYFQFCVDEGGTDKNLDLLTKSYYELCRQKAVNRDFEEINNLMDKVFELNKDNKDLTVLVQICSFLAYDILDTVEGADYAIGYLERANDLCIENEYKNRIYLLYMLGFTHYYLGDVLTANNYYIDALKIANELEDTYWISTISTEIGGNYVLEQNYEKAIEYLLKADEQIENSKREITSLDKIYIQDQLAECYLGLENPEMTWVYLEKEKNIIELFPSGKQKKDAYTKYLVSLGRYYSYMEDYDQAVSCLNTAKERYEKEDYFYYSNFEQFLYEEFGTVYNKMGEVDKALECFKIVEASYEDFGIPQTDMTCLEGIYHAYLQKKDYENASIYAEKLISSLKYYLEGSDHNNAAYLLELFQSQEKQQEIETLTLRNKSLYHIIGSSILLLIVYSYFAVTMIKKRKQIESLNERLTELNKTDELTKLNNRRSLNAYFDEKWGNVCTDKESTSVVMLDVDYFKKYNDFYGHQAGDDVLKSISRIIKNKCGEDNFACRYGGEEFLLILPSTDTIHAMDFITDIQQQVSNLQIPHSKSDVANVVTISGGIATSKEYVEYMKLIRYADDALYQAKVKRNTVVTIECVQ